MDDSWFAETDIKALASTDVLVGEDGPWQANACLQWLVDQDVQAEGYRAAAERLAAGAPGWHEQDSLLYPIVYLYRHYVELRLKDLMALDQRLAGEPLVIPETHDLVNLWGSVKPALLREVEAGDRERKREIRQIERVIKELAALDPRGTAFRYRTDAHGGRPLPDGASRLNLHQFASTMAKPGRALDEMSNWFDILLEREREMASEFGP